MRQVPPQQKQNTAEYTEKWRSPSLVIFCVHQGLIAKSVVFFVMVFLFLFGRWEGSDGITKQYVNQMGTVLVLSVVPGSLKKRKRQRIDYLVFGVVSHSKGEPGKQKERAPSNNGPVSPAPYSLINYILLGWLSVK